ncbi:MAG TPA: HAD family phosphatase [Candidatus Baltobacteraceae bacterium]
MDRCLHSLEPPNLIEAVIFDMDGVLLDSEQIWDKAREKYVKDVGGRWIASAQRDMMGMSSTEWSQYMHDTLSVPRPPKQINADVIKLIEEIYERDGFPIIDGALDAVERISGKWRLGVASSSNRPIIDLVMSSTPFGALFKVTVSSEEVARGKPNPDVYLKAAELLGARPDRCAGVEDSHNGILALRNAGMRAIAIPNLHYPPHPVALRAATVVLATIEQLTPDAVEHGIVTSPQA